MVVRLFTALNVSEILKKQYSALPRFGLDNPHWSHPDDLHITLRFLGEVEEERVPLIEQALENIRVKSFNVTARNLNMFDKKRQAVLYAAIENQKKIFHLTAEITDRLMPLGFVFSERSFTPHITLARLKNPQGLEAYIKYNGNQLHSSWEINNFTLYQSSDPENSGPRYKALKTYPLLEY
jgi:2'-5' RNA ligase